MKTKQTDYRLVDDEGNIRYFASWREATNNMTARDIRQERIGVNHWQTLQTGSEHGYAKSDAPAQAQHSPLPYALRTTRCYKKARKNVRLCDRLGYQVAMIHGSFVTGMTTEESEARKAANAKFLVRACNNAQRLADALRDMLADSRSLEIRHYAETQLAQWEEEAK